MLAGVRLNLANNLQLPIGGSNMLVSKLSTDFQSFVDANTAVDKAKSDTKAQITARVKLKQSVKKELNDFARWAVQRFGEAAYAMFALTPPKPRTVSPTKKAIGLAKAKAKSVAKAAAKAAVAAATAQERLVAYDASGSPIGAAPPAALASVAPAVPVAPAAGVAAK